MSETPKASPKRTTNKTAATKKAVIADASNNKVPAKKAPVKKNTAKKVVDALDEAIAAAEENKGAVKKAVKAVAPSVTEAQVDEVLAEVPTLWAKVKKFLGL
jgi:hypothetical protein